MHGGEDRTLSTCYSAVGAGFKAVGSMHGGEDRTCYSAVRAGFKQ